MDKKLIRSQPGFGSSLIVTNFSCILGNICYNKKVGKIDKLLQKFLNDPKDFEWREFVRILDHFGFKMLSRGMTGGSRRTFENKEGLKLYFHEPHPEKTVKSYMIKYTIETLKKEGVL